MFSRFLQCLPGPHTQLLGHLGTVAAFAAQQVGQHEGSLGAAGPARDLMDAFLLKMAKVGKVGVGGLLAGPHPGGVAGTLCQPPSFSLHVPL